MEKEKRSVPPGAWMIGLGALLTGIAFLPMLQGGTLYGILNSGHAFWIAVGLGTAFAGVLSLTK